MKLRLLNLRYLKFFSPTTRCYTNDQSVLNITKVPQINIHKGVWKNQTKDPNMLSQAEALPSIYWSSNTNATPKCHIKQKILELTRRNINRCVCTYPWILLGTNYYRSRIIDLATCRNVFVTRWLGRPFSWLDTMMLVIDIGFVGRISDYVINYQQLEQFIVYDRTQIIIVQIT